MGHKCTACGETFDTLSRLRLHNCSGATVDTTTSDRAETTATATAMDHEQVDRRQQSRLRDRRRRARRLTSDELNDSLERAQTGDPDSAVVMLAHLERDLKAASERNGHNEHDESGDRYRDVYWTYSELTAEALDTVARGEGWSFLLDVMTAYDPRDEYEIPIVGDPIVNVLARNVVRTRLTEGIDVVPVDALEYLASIPEFSYSGEDVAWEPSMQYGWAIDHPDHSIEATIVEQAPYDSIWAGAAATQALFADQHAAVELYAEVLREVPWEDRALVVDELSQLEGDPDSKRFPEYWDIEAEFDRDFSFEFDESVERELRKVIEDLELDADLGAEWTFADLEVSWEPPPFSEQYW